MNSDSFYAWYDRLPSRKQAEVDNLADEMGLPLYDDCRPDELAQLTIVLLAASLAVPVTQSNGVNQVK